MHHANDVDGTDPVAVFRGFQEAQDASDVQRCLAYLAGDVVFDVGRGRFEGHDGARAFLGMLASLESTTTVVAARRAGADRVAARLVNSDRDLRGMLGIDAIELDVDVEVRDGVITRYHARPTAASLEKLRAARGEGKTSESLRRAERAGTFDDASGGGRDVSS